MTGVSLVLGPRLFQTEVSAASAVPGTVQVFARPYPATVVQTLGNLSVVPHVQAHQNLRIRHASQYCRQ